MDILNALDNKIELNADSLGVKFEKEFDDMSNEEVYSLIKEYYKIILADIFEKKDRKEVSKFIKYFTIPKFIFSLTQAVYSIELDTVSKRRLNKMCYDYLVRKDCFENEYMESLMMSLAKTLNRDVIPKLCSLAIPEDTATTLSLSRYSSEKENINIKRLNKCLMQQSENVLDEQKIIDIYLTLFDRVLPLFTGVMLDVVSPQNMQTTASEEIYGLITLSILDIIDGLPVEEIKKGLKLFDEERRILYPDSSLRMNFKACSPADFPRFCRALDELEAEGINIETR